MCVTHLLSHTPCGHLTTSLPGSLAGHCKALNAALCYYHSQPDRPPVASGLVMPRVCAQSTASYFWPVPWGCGRSENALCRLGWDEISCPRAPGKAPRARKIRNRKSMAGSGHAGANINSNLRDKSVTSPQLEPGPAPLDPHRNLTPNPPINLDLKKSTKTTNFNPQEDQFWGWGYWIDRQTGQIAPPPSEAAKTAAPLPVATATREKSSPTPPINHDLKKSTEATNPNPQEDQFWGWGWWIDRQTGQIAPPPSEAAKSAVPLPVPTATREKSSSTPPINHDLKKSTKTTNPNLQEDQFWGWGCWIDRQTGQIAPPPSVAAKTAAALPVATAAREKTSPTPPVHLDLKKSVETTNLNSQEDQFWGWGCWIDRQTGRIAPPPSVAAKTAVPLPVATAKREKSLLGERSQVKVIWPGRCIVDGDVGDVYCAMS